MKVTISPFGMVPVAGVILAVKVTLAPATDGFNEEVTTVVVEIWDVVTVRATVAECVLVPSVPVTVSV